MKDFFRHPVIGIDRILSSGIKWQLLFLLGVIVAAILLFIVIEWLTGSILTRHYKIFCVNRNTGFRKESRIFYFIHLQNEEDYERKKSSSA